VAHLDHAQIREDLETKLSAALANMEMELKKCSVQKCIDGKLRAYFNVLAPNEEVSGKIFRHISIKRKTYYTTYLKSPVKEAFVVFNIYHS